MGFFQEYVKSYNKYAKIKYQNNFIFQTFKDQIEVIL